MKFPRVVIPATERPAVEIAALRPTAEEDAAWAVEKPRHAWIAFAKFGCIPGLAMLAWGIVSGGSRHHHWWVWLVLAALSGTVACVNWWLMWVVAEEPRRRLKALREARLTAALLTPDHEERTLVPARRDP